jgi:hypothetical protein
MDRDSLFNPWESEEIAPTQLLSTNGSTLARSTSKHTFQITRLRRQPRLYEIGWIISETLKELPLCVRVV